MSDRTGILGVQRGATRRVPRAFVAEAVANFHATVQYRGEMAFWAVAGVVQAVVYLSVWVAVSSASGGDIGGYSAAEFAGYFLVLLVAREFTYTWIPWQVPGHIQMGLLSPLLLRPAHPLVMVAAQVASARLRSSFVLVPLTAVLAIVFGARVDTGWAGLVLGTAVLPIAAAIRLLADSLLACSAFWLVRIDGLRGVYYTTLLFLGGQFVPSDALPGGVREVALALPFYWALGYPIELLIGRADPSSAPTGVAVMVAWAVGLWVALQVVWSRGVARYGAVSG